MSLADPVTITAARTVPGSPGAVWDALTDIATFPRIFTNEGTAAAVRVIRAELDARPGGGWRLDEDHRGKIAPHRGSFTLLDPPRSLAFDTRAGQDGPPAQVTIDLAATADGTRVTLTTRVGGAGRDGEQWIARGRDRVLANLKRVMAEAPRALTLSRHFPCPVELLWDAWTDPARLPLWWGPRGFTCETREIRLGAGGLWRFDMIAPDGTRFRNRHRYTRVEPTSRIDYRLDDDGQGQHAFDASVRFHAEGDGARLTMVMVAGDAAHRDMMAEFGAVEHGYTTLDCLAEAALGAAGAPVVSLSRIYPASPERLWAAWTDPAALAAWFVPDDVTMPEAAFDPREGGGYAALFVERTTGRRFPFAGRYLRLDPPRELAFSHAWEGGPETEITVSFAPTIRGTRLTLLQRGLASASGAASHAEGWGQVLAHLARHLEGER